MTTFSFYSFRIFKISPYINFLKFLGRILAPPSGRRPGADAPPPAPPRYATDYSKLCNNLWIIGLKHHFKKIAKFENCKKIYKIYIYVKCYAQNSVRNDIRCMMGYGFDSWFF